MRSGIRKYIVFVLLSGFCSAGVLAQGNNSFANQTLRARTWGDYPIVLSNEVKGGIHHITSLPGGNLALVNDSIPAERRQEGMICVVGDITWTAADMVLMYNGTEWNRIQYLRVWKSGENYFTGQVVFENGKLYVARVNNPTSQPSVNTTEWHDLAAKLDQITVADADANDGLTYNTSGNEYDVNVDNSTLSISGDNLQVRDLGITTGKLADNAVDADKLAVSGNGTSGQILCSNADGTFFWEDAANLSVNPNNIDLASANLLVGNASGQAQARALSGDVSITNTGVTSVPGLAVNATAIAAEATTRASEDADLQSELDATQTGAGLGTGGTYTANGSANYISTSTSLSDADNDLDAAIKANADAIASGGTDLSALQTEVDAIETGAGLNANGTYTANGGTNYISGATSLDNADILLDGRAKTNADNIAANVTAIAAEASARSTADANLQSELDATQTGAGLGTGGAYTANGSANYISTSSSLTDADNDLDAAIKANADAIASGGTDLSALQTEVDAIETGAGLNANGTYTANGGTNYISGATSLDNADILLDSRAKTNADNIAANTTAIAAEASVRSTADGNLQSELDATQTGAGLGTGGAYTANGSANYISTSTSLSDADNDLDAAIKANADAIASGGTDLSTLQTEVDAIETGAGLNANGTYTANGGTNYISGATSLDNADILLDSRAKTNADNIAANVTAIAAEASARSSADANLQNSIDAINQLNSGQIYIGNASNVATAQTMSGDASLSNTGALSLNANVVGASELNVSGNGTSGQVLTSNGAGAFNWQTLNVNTSTVTFVNSAGTLTTAQQGVIMCDGTFTLTLPAASSNGLTYSIKNINTGSVLVDGNGSQTIDGDANYRLGEQYASITLVSYNSAWHIIDRQAKNTVYIGNPGADGSWRITIGSGNSLSFEQYDTSVSNWIFKMEIEE